MPCYNITYYGNANQRLDLDIAPHRRHSVKPFDKLRSSLTFWQQVAMVTLGYGAVMFLLALTFSDALGFANIFTLLTAKELSLLLVSGGTIGLHFFRSHWEKQGRWADVKWFAIALQGALFLLTLATGSTPLLGTYFSVVAVCHFALPRLKQQPAASAE